MGIREDLNAAKTQMLRERLAWAPDAKPRRHEEDDLQMAIVQHLRLLAPKNVLWWHCPNGGTRSKRMGARLKAMGVRPGVFDLNFILADGRFAAMELKAPKDGRMSKAQHDFEDTCADLGVETCVCSNINSALQVLVAWKVLPKSVL